MLTGVDSVLLLLFPHTLGLFLVQDWKQYLRAVQVKVQLAKEEYYKAKAATKPTALACA